MRKLRQRFWFAVMDVAWSMGGDVSSRRFQIYLYAVGKAADCEDWS